MVVELTGQVLLPAIDSDVCWGYKTSQVDFYSKQGIRISLPLLHDPLNPRPVFILDIASAMAGETLTTPHRYPVVECRVGLVSMHAVLLSEMART